MDRDSPGPPIFGRSEGNSVRQGLSAMMEGGEEMTMTALSLESGRMGVALCMGGGGWRVGQQTLGQVWAPVASML